MAMVTHNVTAPDGSILHIEGPEDADPAAIVKYAQDFAYPAYLREQKAKAEPPKDNYPTLAAVADVPLSVGRGALNGIQMITDAFGANNPVSKTLSSVDTTLADLMSAQSKKDSQEIARIMDEAKDKGTLEQVKAGLKALSIAPVDLITNALGTAAPVVIAGLVATVAAPAVATAAGASAATAAAIGAGAGVATELGIGAVSGAGTIKNRIYGDVKQALTDQGVTPEKAEAAAQEAQAYNGKNLDQILLGTLFGAGASVTGAEATLVKGMASKILENTAEIAAKEAKKHVAKGVSGRFVEGAVKEAIPEAAQEAQEQVASNVAQQREGMDVPTFRGAATAATLAGVTGGVLGGGLDVALKPGPRTVDKEAENKALLDDLRTHQADLAASRETLRLEDMTGNQRLDLAERLRDKVPALGEILDSTVPRDVKLGLIDAQLRNAGLGNVDPAAIGLKGTLSLPSPEIKKSENIRQVFNNALDIADQAGVPLADLTVNRGPEGFRIVSPDGEIMSDPMPNGTEREANLVLEGLRRTHDARQTEAYKSASDEYRQEFHQTMARVTAAAAREATTPLNPIPMSDIQNISLDLANRIREGRRQSQTNMTNAEIEGPATFDEMRIRGASREMLTDLAKDQQPYTAGTGKIIPDIEQELLASRPSKPVQTAKTEEQLARQKYATVTPVGSEEADAEFSRSKRNQPSEEQQAFDEREGTAPVKPLRPEREAYPELTPTPRPSEEEVTQARQRIEDRIAKLEATGKQGQAIGKGVREAIADSNFTPEQLVNAFQIADISARLLGKTDADPHALEFVQRIATPTGETAGGARIAPTENVQGLIRMSLDPNYHANATSTSAHESFHILQDLFAAYDKAGATIINNAFKGAKSFDDIDANLLRKLKSLRDPDTRSSVYDTLKEHVPQEVLDGYDQATREREMQAYVFGYMDNAITNGNQNMGGLGAAFVRFLNYFRQFKDRVANYYKGLGYNTAEDVIAATSRGERQAGLGVAGERVEKALPGVAFDFSRGKEPSKVVTQQGKGEQNEERYKQDRDGGGRIPSTGTKSFKALEGTPVVEGASGPNQNLISIAEKYAKDAGFRLSRQAEYVKVDEDFATNIANAYEEMAAEPSSTEVLEAYRDLIRQTTDQYLALEAAGYKFYFFNPNSFDPYSGMPGGFGNPWNALRDLRANKTMAVFPTSEGYGTEGITDTDLNDNPMLQDTGMRWPDQDGVMQPVTANDLFRAVHDVFGHGLEGAGFRARGEENAYQSHVRLFYGPAVKAMTTETRGQNSWLNFGPYGKQNQNAKVEGTIFAQNKIGILPSWTWEDRIAPSSPLEEEEFSRAKPSEVPLQDRIPGLKGVWPHLTSDERERLITTSAKNLVKRFDELPSSAEMAAVAFSGRAKRGWYYNSAKALINIFGLSDGRRFAALLAATSPQTSVQSNLINALNIWKNWVNAGRPTDRKQILAIMGRSVEGNRGEDSVLDAWKNNTIRALATKDAHLIDLDISGPKVNSFMKNLWGVTQEVTNDAWIANYAGVDQKIFARAPGPEDELGVVGVKSTGYMAMSAVTRKAASILSKKTGMTWTPDEVQETVWSWAKALYEMRRGRGKGITTKALLRQGELTADRVNAVPDFEILFVQNVYRKILEDAGYGEQVGRQAEIVQERGASSTGNGARIDAFDAENSGFAQPDFQRHLLRAAGRLEKLYQTRLKAGEPVEEEFSRAIAATKQEKEAKDNSERHFQVWDKAREFFNPLALVNNLPQFLSFRNVTTGSITTSEQYARKMADKIAKGSVEERQAVYKYMTTKAGDSSLIKDPEIRKAAIEAKKAINNYAKIMVARGELTEESFDKYYDRYLPRIYLLYEATNRGMKTPMGGVSVREYLDQRDEELSEDYRKVLGEIKDPSYLTYVALSRPARDIAMSDFLNNIFIFGGDPKNQWIAPESFVDYGGKRYTPYDLQNKAEDLESVAAIAKELSKDQADAMLAEASKMRQAAMVAQKDLEYKLDAIKARGYMQIPDRRQFGPLAGAVVQKGIFQDLVGTFIPVGKENRSMIERIIGDEHSAIGKATSLWKLGKTTLNPPTQVVNFVSNAVSLNLFGGVPVHKFPYLFDKTLREMRNNGKMWQEAQKFGISGGTMSKAELDRAFIRMKRYQAKAGGEGNLANMFATSRAIGSAFIEKAGDAYQFSESLFKVMMYIHSVENENMKPSDAVNAANDVLFDYSLVNNNVRWLRNAPLGLPFITYYYKALPKLIETLYKHPARFIPYFAMAYALPAMTMAAFDLNDDELEKLRKSTQDYVRDSGTMFFLPIRNSKGDIEFVDLGKYLPFSTFLSPFITAFKYGEYAKGAKELIQPITPSGPIVTVIEALGTGNDPFTGKPIMDPRDTNKAQALSMFSYIWNQAMPPVIGMDFNNPEKSSGALPRIYNSLFVDGMGVDKRGMPKPEALESAARLLGLNITPLKADVQRIQNINYMMSEINKTKSFQAQIAKDQSMTPQRRMEKIRELGEKIKDQVAEMQGYANETANIGQITKKIKEAP